MNKIKIKKQHLNNLIGVFLILLALLILLSPGTIFKFFAIPIVAAFGFIGFWILIPTLFIIAIYSFLKEKLKARKFSVSLIGLYLLILAVLVIASVFCSRGQEVILYGSTDETKIVLDGFSKVDGNALYLEFKTCTNYFEQILYSESCCGKEGFNNASLVMHPQLGGGYLGFVIAGSLNSLITPIATIVVSFVIVAISLGMIFHNQLKLLFKKIKTRVKQPKKEKVKKVVEPKVTVQPKVENTPIVPQKTNIPVENVNYSNYGQTSALHQAHFDFDEPSTTVVKQEKAPSQLERAIITEAKYIEDDPFASLNQETPVIQKPVEVTPVKPVETKVEEPIVQQEEQPIINNDAPISEPLTPLFTEPSPIKEVLLNSGVESEIENEVEQSGEKEESFSFRMPNKYVEKPDFHLPPTALLQYHESLEDLSKNDASCQKYKTIIDTVYKNMSVDAHVSGYVVGPTVTEFAIEIGPTTMPNTLSKYTDKIAQALGGKFVRFEALVEGQTYSSIEVPNNIRTNVGLREVVEEMNNTQGLPRTEIPFGKGVGGKIVHANLADFPHMLLAGTTGSGKTIYLHSILLTLLMRNTPEELRLILIDPKHVEFNMYTGIPHLLCPIVSEMSKVEVCFKKIVEEMERRYQVMQHFGYRNVNSYNKHAKELGYEPFPTIVVVIDEFADLKEQCKDIRSAMTRLSSKARAANINLIVCTQRPSVDVIDGTIKSNLSVRVSLMVGTAIDSQTILGCAGAENLLPHGDSLVDCSYLQGKGCHRAQGAFMEDEEIIEICNYLRKEAEPQYDPIFLDLEDHSQDSCVTDSHVTPVSKDAKDDELVEVVRNDLLTKDYCSISFVQRSYGIGFPRAGKIVNQLQKEGVLSTAQEGIKGFKVLNKQEPLPEMGSIDQSTFIPNSGNED